MSSKKDVFKNPSYNDKPKTLDFSLQSGATKPYDLGRIMGKPAETKDETTETQSTSQEGK